LASDSIFIGIDNIIQKNKIVVPKIRDFSPFKGS
jgi:hypothetical protein